MEEDNPYPIRFIDPVKLKDNTLIQLRPIHPEDGNQATSFREKLSAESVRNRFLGYMPSVSEKLIDRLTNIDYTQEMAIVAEVKTPEGKEVIAIGRIAGEYESGADFAIIIVDDWQGKGLGAILTDYLVRVARAMGFGKVYATVFASNVRMLEILRHRGFVLKKEAQHTVYAELILDS